MKSAFRSSLSQVNISHLVTWQVNWVNQEKILILTPDVDQAQQLETSILGPNNYQATISAHLEEAFQLLETTVFKAGLVGLSAQPLLAFLKQLAERRVKLPIVLLCDQEQKTIPLEALAYNIKGYITYPFAVTETLETLRKVLKTTGRETRYQALLDELSTFNTLLEGRIREVTALQGIGRPTNLTLDLDEVLNRVVETATAMTNAEEGCLMLLEPETGELYIHAAQNVGERSARMTGQKISDSVAGAVVQSGQPIILNGGPNKRFRVKTGYTVQALLNVPLKVGDRVTGILSVGNLSNTDPFTMEDLGCLSALANKIATTIENVRIYLQASHNLTKHVEELDLLRGLMRDLSAATERELVAQLALSQALKAVQAEAGVLGWVGHGEPLWISQGALTHPFRHDHPSTDLLSRSQKDLAEVITTGKPSLVVASEPTYAGQTFQSQLAVPLKCNKTIVGVISLKSTQVNQFDHEDLYRLQTIAYQAALALQAASLAEIVGCHQEYLTLLMNNTKDAVWLVNTELQALAINPTACRLLGWQSKEVMGQDFASLWPENTSSGYQELGKYLERAMTLGEAVSFTQGVTVTLENNFTNVIEGVVYPLFNHRRVTGAMTIFRQLSPERDLERLQADFISMASHNLRTPLMAIQASLDYVLEAKADEARKKQFLLEARSQSRKIALFLRELLDISQSALAKETMTSIRPVNFLPLLQAAVAKSQTEIPCALEAPKNLPLISTDAAKVEIILQHLIAHGKRRNKAGAALKIIVVVEEQEKEIIVSVIDHGETIPPQHYSQVFWHIYPLEANKDHNSMPYGYNLGLFTTRRLVELVGGKIWLSQPNGYGVSVNFTLPIWR